MNNEQYCESHTPCKLPDIKHYEWMTLKARRGHKQRYCDKCKRWLFKCEWGKDLKGFNNAKRFRRI
jgi:hypothetical protein